MRGSSTGRRPSSLRWQRPRRRRRLSFQVLRAQSRKPSTGPTQPLMEKRASRERGRRVVPTGGSCAKRLPRERCRYCGCRRPSSASGWSRTCSAGVRGPSRRETGRPAQEASFCRARIYSPTKSMDLSPSLVFSNQSSASAPPATLVTPREHMLHCDRTERFRSRNKAAKDAPGSFLNSLRSISERGTPSMSHFISLAMACLPRFVKAIVDGAVQNASTQKNVWPRRLRQNLSPAERTP